MPAQATFASGRASRTAEESSSPPVGRGSESAPGGVRFDETSIVAEDAATAATAEPALEGTENVNVKAMMKRWNQWLGPGSPLPEGEQSSAGASSSASESASEDKAAKLPEIDSIEKALDKAPDSEAEKEVGVIDREIVTSFKDATGETATTEEIATLMTEDEASGAETSEATALEDMAEDSGPVSAEEEQAKAAQMIQKYAIPALRAKEKLKENHSRDPPVP